MSSAAALFRDALILPVPDRADLALRLIESLDSETTSDVEAAWATEIQTRVEALRRGEASARPAKDVFHEARLRLASRSR